MADSIVANFASLSRISPRSRRLPARSRRFSPRCGGFLSFNAGFQLDRGVFQRDLTISGPIVANVASLSRIPARSPVCRLVQPIEHLYEGMGVWKDAANFRSPTQAEEFI